MVWKFEADGQTGRTVIWQGADDVVADPAADWDRVSFHSDLYYPAAAQFVSRTVNLANSADGTVLTQYRQYTAYNHGRAGRPLVLASLRNLALAGGADVPMLGTVPVQQAGAGTALIRWLTLMVTTSMVGLWEICPGYGSGTIILPAMSVTLDMWIFDQVMDDDLPAKTSTVLDWSPTRFVASGGRFDSDKHYIRKTTNNVGSYALSSGGTIQHVRTGTDINVQFRNGTYAVNAKNNIAFTVPVQRVTLE